MTQLITEQMLEMPYVGREPECSEEPASIRHQAADTLSDQGPNDEVVERPPCVVGCRHGVFDEADRVVDNELRHAERPTLLIASDRDCDLDTRDGRVDLVQPTLRFRRPRFASAPQHEVEIVDCPPWVSHHVTLDTSARRSSEVRPRRLATASAEALRVIPREDEDAAPKPGPRQNSQRPLIEVLVERLTGGRSGQHHVQARRFPKEQDQRNEALWPPHRRRQ
ncbi:MAG TPA: hypothetical protein VME22_32930 [Solirubrobacteraceae bacterium]|nr:hypothetical protein [Solirubrobacteraceae bacterium]